MGLLNQFRQFNQAVTKNSYMIKPLLSSKGQYIWLPEHQKAFHVLKEELSKSPSLAHFDPKAETRIETDASRKKGFGYALLQKHGDEWKMIAAGSRYLKDVETRYAMVELESLAIHYGIKQCHLYLSGLPHFDVITDHQLLKTIFNKKDLYEIDNDKLRKIKQELQSKYVFTIEYRKGPNHIVLDALSRNPVKDPDHDEDKEIDFKRLSPITSCLGTKDLNIEHLEQDTLKDDRYQELYKAVVNGFDDFKSTYGKRTNSPSYQYIQNFRPHWKNLSTEGKLVVLNDPIFVPEQCRSKILKILHSGHQGITRMLQNAR